MCRYAVPGAIALLIGSIALLVGAIALLIGSIALLVGAIEVIELTFLTKKSQVIRNLTLD